MWIVCTAYVLQKMSCLIFSEKWMLSAAIVVDDLMTHTDIFLCNNNNKKNQYYRLTHFSLETPKRIFGKQCKPRSDTAKFFRTPYSHITKVGRQIPPPVFTSGICRYLPVWKILLKWQILANIFAYRQTVWTQIRLLLKGAVWSGSTLFATMTFKVTGRRQSRQQLLHDPFFFFFFFQNGQ